MHYMAGDSAEERGQTHENNRDGLYHRVKAVLYGLLQVQIDKIQRVQTQLQDLFLSNLSFAI